MRIHLLSLGVGIVVGVGIGALFSFLIASGSVLRLSERYTVRLRIDVMRSHQWARDHGVVVAFLRGNESVCDCWVGGSWVNVTLAKGEYFLKVYDGSSGEYVRQYQVLLVKDMELTMVL